MPFTKPAGKYPSTGVNATGKVGATNYTNGQYARDVCIYVAGAGGVCSMTITPAGGSAYTISGMIYGGFWRIPPNATYNFSASGGSITSWSEQDF